WPPWWSGRSTRRSSPAVERGFGEAEGQAAGAGDPVVEGLERALVRGADPFDLDGAGEVRGRLGGPGAVAADFALGGAGRQRRLGGHERLGLLDRHVAAVQRGVDDDAGGPEDPEV